ncbi:MAG: betC 1 [Planctomycetota bacterium]|nr:betC 1 [Planctomycetota bacterium]
MMDRTHLPTVTSPRWRVAAALLGVAVWVGLLASLAEIGAIAARENLGAIVTTDLIRLNRHASWMIPTSNAGIFLAIGLLLAGLAMASPRLARRLAGPLLGTLAFGAVLLRVPALHEAARWTVALGLGVQATRIARRHAVGFARVVRWSLPVLLASAAILGPLGYRRVLDAEARTLADLPSPQPGAPNVLLIVLDTVRADHLSLYGYARDTTPNLRRLAERGIRFDQARSTAPWTLPSHASMLTGRWPHQLAADEDHAMNREDPTLAEFLGSKGYATAGFVANTYYCNRAFGLARGFARYEDCDENSEVSLAEVLRCGSLGRLANRFASLAGSCLPPEATGEKIAERMNRDTLAWIDAKKSRPFFAFVNYFDVHTPYILPEGNHRRFGIRPETPKDFATLRGWHDANKQNVTPHQAALVCDAYDDQIGYVDDQIGRLIDGLEARGVLKNTVVIVTSDHGEHLGEHHIYGHGRSLYRQELHVPLLIVAPGAPQGRVVADPASLRDLPATIADLAGLGAPFPGSSLASSWNVPGSPPRPVLAEVRHRVKTSSKNPNRPPAWRGPMSSVVDNGLVYIRNADGREEIYDVRSDPGETRDLARTDRAESLLSPFRTTLSRLNNGDEAAEIPRIAAGGGEKAHR